MVGREQKRCARCRPQQANGKPQVVLLLAGLMAFLTAGVAAEGAPEAVSKGVTSTWKPAQESVFHIVETPEALTSGGGESNGRVLSSLTGGYGEKVSGSLNPSVGPP